MESFRVHVMAGIKIKEGIFLTPIISAQPPYSPHFLRWDHQIKGLAAHRQYRDLATLSQYHIRHRELWGWRTRDGAS